MTRSSPYLAAAFRSSRRRLISVVLLAVCVCASTFCHRPAARPVAATGEVSVNPGINQSYRDDPDVETWAARFEAESREIFRERERIVDLLDLRPGMRVADIGAGTGFFTAMMAERVGPNGRVYAVDIMPEFLEHIDDRAETAGHTWIETVLCSEESVELPPDSVDLAFTCDTYHHFQFPKSTLASIRRALKPSGEFIVIDFERIPGESREWVLDHVRAGKDEVIAEIRSAGFDLVEELPSQFLEENYVLRFRNAQ